jgi:glutamyl-tRNA synthetase
VARYPGICRNLTEAERIDRRRRRQPALRLRADGALYTVHDMLHGDITAEVDDVVLRRNDGVAAYNLAVIVDDAFSAVDQVVRGDDLLPAAVSQAFLAELLGHRPPVYAHVPLAVNATGHRLAKRDGAVTLPELAARGWESGTVLGLIADSLDLASPGEHVSLVALLERFDPGRLPRHPWVVKGLRSARDHLG